MEEYKCKYCERIFLKKQSRSSHQKWCNPKTRPTKMPDHSGAKNPMFGKSNKGKNQWAKKDWNNTPFNDLGWRRKRKFLLEESSYRCSMCEFSKTREDGTIILQIDHIDGDRKNNCKDNLRVLCPNCHAVHSHKFMHIGQHHSEETKKIISEKNKLCSRIPSVS